MGISNFLKFGDALQVNMGMQRLIEEAIDYGASHLVSIDYTNYRGERGTRQIIPKEVVFGANEWHREPQWLLVAHDVEKGAERTFAMKDIHAWNA